MNSAAKLFLIVLLSLSTSVAQADNQIPTIGIITDLSGRFASWGKQTALGVRLVEEDLHKHAVPAKFLIEDCGLDAKKAVTAAQKLISIDNVDAIYVEATPPSVAVAPVAAQHKLLFLYIALAQSPVNTNPFALKSYTEADTGCEKVARRWRAQGLKSVGTLKASAEYSEVCLEGIRRVYPDVVVSEYNLGDDVSSNVLFLRSKNVEGIFNLGYESDAVNMFRALGRLQFVPYVLASHIAMTAETMKYVSAEQLAKVTTYGLKPIAVEFLNRIRAIDPKNDFTNVEGAAYASVHLPMLVDAVRSCPAKDVTCQLEKMRASKPNELIGFQGWKPTRVADNGLVIYTWSGGVAQPVSE